jgi:hypothetical protein
MKQGATSPDHRCSVASIGKEMTNVKERGVEIIKSAPFGN